MLKIGVEKIELEPGRHIARKTINRFGPVFHLLPLDECQEVRPDWGEYLPVTTFQAIERALRKRGFLEPVYDPFNWTYWIEKE